MQEWNKCFMKRLCKVCNKRKAGYFTRTSGRSYTDKQHDLCMRCYRAELNRLHQKFLQNVSNSLADIGNYEVNE